MDFGAARSAPWRFFDRHKARGRRSGTDVFFREGYPNELFHVCADALVRLFALSAWCNVSHVDMTGICSNPMVAAATTSLIHAPTVTFRGSRNYVHSTTLYEELLVGANSIGPVIDGPIQLKLRRLLTNQPEFRYAQTLNALPADAPVIFSIEIASVSWRGVVVERDAPVLDRKPYDEQPIWQLAKMEGQAVRFEGQTGLRPVEVVTALNLLLHQNLFSVAEDRKWYLARIELPRPLKAEDAHLVRLELTRTLGSAMTRSSIIMCDGSIGHLEFMLGHVMR